jgi:hypothetical protein
MNILDICDQEPEPDHPARREEAPQHRRPSMSTRLNGRTSAESARSTARPRSSGQEGAIIPAFDVDVLCKSAEAAMELSITWGEFCEISPHRPQHREVAGGMGLKVLPEFANIPRIGRPETR